ncbi:MAG: DUF2442 domain-containing protein [Spirochaetota bacterium]|nr:DUF2442 domain-containing protein [Spirochaetota bacterium]
MEYSYINKAVYKKSYCIYCTFKDGKSGTIDLSTYIDKGGVFDKLRDENYAKQFKLVDGVLCWGDGELDIAPETVYSLATGTPLPLWMTSELNDVQVR